MLRLRLLRGDEEQFLELQTVRVAIVLVLEEILHTSGVILASQNSIVLSFSICYEQIVAKFIRDKRVCLSGILIVFEAFFQLFSYVSLYFFQLQQHPTFVPANVACKFSSAF